MIEKTIKKLIELKKTISTMESCSGGALANAITNIPDASKIFSFGAVTYSNEYKIKMGVSSEVIDKFTVYSMETADEMSKNITKFAKSDYGVGITGQLNRQDPANPVGKDNVVYVSIYDSKNNKYYRDTMEVHKESRKLNKEHVIERIIEMLLEILK